MIYIENHKITIELSSNFQQEYLIYSDENILSWWFNFCQSVPIGNLQSQFNLKIRI